MEVTVAAKMYRVWSEWDCGEENIIFKTKADAMDWVEENPYLKEVECGYTNEELWNEGLIGIEEVEVYEND
jgi:hypothetical protein